MWFNWRKFIPKITWAKDIDKENLYSIVLEMNDINRGLNIFIGHLTRQVDELKAEAIELLTAIALQHGGELLINNDFFSTILENPDMTLKIEKMENKDILLKIGVVEQEDEKFSKN